MYDLKIYFLLFIIYSVVGWIIEMIDVAGNKMKFQTV